MKAVQATIYVTSDNKKYFTAFGAAYREAVIQYEKSRENDPTYYKTTQEWGETPSADKAVRAIAKKILEDFKASRISSVSNAEMAHRQEITPLPEEHPSVIATKEQLESASGSYVSVSDARGQGPIPVVPILPPRGAAIETRPQTIPPKPTNLNNEEICNMVLLESELISLSKHVDPSEVMKRALTGIKLKDVPEQLIRDTYWRLVDDGSIKV